MDFKKITNIEIEGVERKDHPDYCDAFLSGADYDGKEMTDEELETLQSQYPDWFHEQVLESIN